MLRSATACTRRALLRAALGLGALALLPGLAAGNELPEYRLKAAFLYNFTVFTEWPAETGGTLNLCLVGNDPFGSEIDGLQGKAVGARLLAVQRRVGIDALRHCQVVFVPAPSIGQLPRIVEALRNQPALVITESPGALRQGAMLNMNLAANRVTFEANLEAARGARLNLSSKLLRLATEVVQ